MKILSFVTASSHASLSSNDSDFAVLLMLILLSLSTLPDLLEYGIKRYIQLMIWLRQKQEKRIAKTKIIGNAATFLFVDLGGNTTGEGIDHITAFWILLFGPVLLYCAFEYGIKGFIWLRESRRKKLAKKLSTHKEG